MEKLWHIKPHDAAVVTALERSANIPSVIAQLMIGRGITDRESALLFLESKLNGLRDPELLPGISQAATQITNSIRSAERIIIYGDYDADGMTSSAILYRCLKLLDANVGYYVPSRMTEGYGLNCEAIEKIARTGAALIITVDCGITSVAEAQKARELGVQLVITDHHEFGSELPDAATIVHPALPGSNYPFRGLCGAGVAFKLAWALCQRAGDTKKVSPRCRAFLMSAIGLAAIGTVADVVPLIDENRIIVKHGLRSLKAEPTAGVERLLKLTELDKKSELQCEDIGFVIGPRLNAAGRLGQAQLGIELLTTEDPGRADDLANYIHELNNSRASLERKIFKAANEQIKEQFDPESEPAIVVSGRGWHQGVIGIVAGRLAERYHRPVVVIAVEEFGNKPATGSARSVPGVNLNEALRGCTEQLVAHGGHAAAAGLRIDESLIDRFRANFCEQIAEQFSEEKRTAEISIDTEAALSGMTLNTVQLIDSLAPFGEGNPRPLFCTSGVDISGEPKTMGKGERHLSLTLKQHQVTFRAVAFNQAEWVEPLKNHSGPLDVAYRPIINEFRGRRSVELHLVDWKPAQQIAAARAS